jgi:hypothetical protein
MPTYQLLVSEHTAYYVEIEADSEDEAIEDYYENGGDGYGQRIIENYVVEAKELEQSIG